MSNFSKRDTRGASLIGYALVVGLVSVVALGAIGSGGDQINTLFSNVGGKLDAVAQSSISLPALPSPSASASSSPVNQPPQLLSGSSINGGAGAQTGLDITSSILALFTDLEGHTPLSVSAASGGDSCVTNVSYASGMVSINTANSSCTGTVTVTVADSLGAVSSATPLSVSVTAVSSSQIAQGAGTVIHNMDNSGGPVSAAFDGTTSQTYTQGPRRNLVPDAYIGKDWGASTSYVITRFEVWGASDIGLNNGAGYPEANNQLILEGSNDGSNFTPLHTTSAVTDYNGITFDESFSANPVTDAYRYHRIRFTLTNYQTVKNCCNVAEVRFYGYQYP